MRLSTLTLLLTSIASISCLPHRDPSEANDLGSRSSDNINADMSITALSENAKTVMAPNKYGTTEPLVFLSGSISKTGANWRDELSKALSSFPITILNPERKDWDSSWKTDISDPKFEGQVEWELDGMTAAKVLAVYFEDHTDAPITLLELGLFARTESKKIVVGMASGYSKKGNVQVVCAKYKIKLVEGQEKFVEAVKAKLG